MRPMMSSVVPGSARREPVDGLAGHVAEAVDHIGIMRVQTAGNDRLAAPGHPPRHQHSLTGRRRAVIHGGVGHLHAGQPAHLGLELEQNLQRALADLGLVRRVGGQELRALDQVIDARRHMVLVGAGADEERHRARGHVLVRQPREMPLDLEFALVRAQPGDAVEETGGGHRRHRAR